MKKELFAFVCGVVAIACARCCSDTDSGRCKVIDWTDDDVLSIQNYVAWAEDVGNEYMNLCYIVGERYWALETDGVQACVWWRKAAEMGHAGAQQSLGSCYLAGIGVEQDVRAGFQWMLRAAEQGDVEAQCVVADCYSFGKIVEQSDAKCIYWLSKAASQGDEWARKRLKDMGVIE